MHGAELTAVEIQDIWAYIRTLGSIASEILPADPPSLAPHLALQLEFDFAYLLYQMSRLVARKPTNKNKVFKDSNKIFLYMWSIAFDLVVLICLSIFSDVVN